MSESATATEPLPKHKKLYQKKGVDELLCPICAADVVRDGCRFNCKCGVSWSIFFNVFMPSPRALVSRVITSEGFKARYTCDKKQIAETCVRLVGFLTDVKTKGLDTAIKRIREGHYAKVAKKGE